jgi:membrane protein DedA with SNARE-associated domain
LKRVVKAIGLHPENMQAVRSYFGANPARTISLSKITLGVGFAGIYMAGIAKIPYKKFISVCLLTSALQYIVYLSVGLLFGSAYRQIDHYMDIFTALTIVIVLTILLFIFIKSKRRTL